MPAAWVGATIGLGVLFGLAAAVLLHGPTLEPDDAWGILLGTSLLAIGVASRIGMSALTVAFFAGLTLSIASRHRATLRSMIAPTERPVMLPALLLAGAKIEWRSTPQLAALAAIAIAVRFLAKLGCGIVLSRASPAARRASPFFGATLWSSGSLSIAIGLAFALRFPGTVGEAILATVALVTVAGEVGGPIRMLSEIRRAGEIEAPAPVSPPATPPASPAPPGPPSAGVRGHGGATP
jgi:Kef-type K+ transport system membrane component KefB